VTYDVRGLMAEGREIIDNNSKNMANKILFIGIGGAGSIVADKVMKDYPELFNSIAIDGHPIGDKGTSCPYIDLMEGRDENPGFMKTHMQELLEEKMYEIREIFNQYLNDEEGRT
jgi:hypothetical protein